MPTSVLVVDDLPHIRLLLTLALPVWEGDLQVVAEARDGEEAVEAALRHQPDAIVLDWRMPGCDGLAVLPRLRAAAPDARIVMYSVSGRRDLAPVARQLGADVCVPKDGAVDALAAALVGRA